MYASGSSSIRPFRDFACRRMLSVAEAVGRVVLWAEVAHQRRQLASLDGRMLKDMGLEPGAVYREARRPFWDV